MPSKKSAAKKPAQKATKKTPTKKTSTKKTPTKKTSTKKTASNRGGEASMSPRMKEMLEHYDKIYGKGYFAPTKVKCPLCGNGVIVPKRGRFGPEWRCNAEVRPMCKFKLDTKPTGKTCTHKRGRKLCGALIEAGTKTIRNRCSDKSCPNRNPHKL